jgi:hypothetical protein
MMMLRNVRWVWLVHLVFFTVTHQYRHSHTPLKADRLFLWLIQCACHANARSSVRPCRKCIILTLVWGGFEASGDRSSTELAPSDYGKKRAAFMRSDNLWGITVGCSLPAIRLHVLLVNSSSISMISFICKV